MVVLIIATHPDDQVLGCGGVMARHMTLGDNVHVLVVTRGAPELFRPEMVEQGPKESSAAHQVLDVSSGRETATLAAASPIASEEVIR